MAITQKQMIDGIRRLVVECEGDEKSVLDALLDESENWRMRMVEIEAEEGRKNMLVSCQNFECAVAPSVTGETQDEGAYNWNRRERTEFGQILAGLKDRGMITQADVDRLERDGMKEVDHA